MRQHLIDLLKATEAAVPPPTNCHHAITFARYGSDEAGWEDKLALQVNRDGVFHCFFLDDVDFSRPIANIVAYIRVSLANPSRSDQLGVALGQYTE